MTVPLGVLKSGSVDVQPVMPRQKVAALERLEMGTLDKVVMRFGQVFWNDGVEFFAGLESECSQLMSFLNFHPYSGEPILIGLARG